MPHEGAQGLHDVVSIDHGSLGHDVGVDLPGTVKKLITIMFGAAKSSSPSCLVRLDWTLALTGPGFPFWIHCFDYFFSYECSS